MIKVTAPNGGRPCRVYRPEDEEAVKLIAETMPRMLTELAVRSIAYLFYIINACHEL